MVTKILVVEDDPEVRRLMAFLLDNEGFTVYASEDGRQALDAIDGIKPDMVLIDLAMPNLDGFQLAEELRSRPEYQKIPIMAVTARDQQVDKYGAYKAGANAFLTKPFDPLELLYKVRSLISLTSTEEASQTLEVGRLKLEPATYTVYRDGQEIQLTKMETAILMTLMQAPGDIFPAEKLSDAVHDKNRSTDAVHAHIRNLRNKIEQDPKDPTFILTMGRKGYSFSPGC